MKKFICLFAIGLSLVGCKNSNEKTELSSKVSVEEPITTEPKEVLTEAENDSIKIMTDELQGVWKRTTYPYDELVFRPNQVKFIQGEGAAEPAVFEPLEISGTCPFETVRLGAPLSGLYIIREKYKTCEVIRIENDTLKLSNAKMDYTIPYVRKEQQ